MYRGNENLPFEEINILCSDGGLGDNICRLPAIKYILDHFPHVFLHLWFPDYFVDFAKHCLKGYNNKIIRGFSHKKLYNNSLSGIDCGSSGEHSSMSTHLVDHAFHMIADRQVDAIYKNYVPIRAKEIQVILPAEKYVVVTTGFTASVREMLPHTVNEIVSYIQKKGYVPVFLGNKITPTGSEHIIEGTFKQEINYDVGVNLIGKTDLLQAAKICGEAAAVVGLDNGLLHVAATTDVPIVLGFTTVKPEQRLPYRHGILGWNCYSAVPPESLACRFCQSNWGFMYDHDFKYCYYKDYACTKQLNSLKYIEQLEKILK